MTNALNMMKTNVSAACPGIKTSPRSMRGVFAGLSIPEFNAGQLALAGAGGGTVSRSRIISRGCLTVKVNGCSVQKDGGLADKAADRIKAMLNEDEVWGR